jgi:hypothetical protein
VQSFAPDNPSLNIKLLLAGAVLELALLRHQINSALKAAWSKWRSAVRGSGELMLLLTTKEIQSVSGHSLFPRFLKSSLPRRMSPLLAWINRKVGSAFTDSGAVIDGETQKRASAPAQMDDTRNPLNSFAYSRQGFNAGVSSDSARANRSAKRVGSFSFRRFAVASPGASLKVYFHRRSAATRASFRVSCPNVAAIL